MDGSRFHYARCLELLPEHFETHHRSYRYTKDDALISWMRRSWIGQDLIVPLQWFQRLSLCDEKFATLVKNITEDSYVATCVRFSRRSSITSGVLDLAQCFLESW